MISYQKSLFSPVLPCDGETFKKIISSPQVADIARQVAALRTRELASADETERHTLHDEQGRLKKKLPAFLFMASFPGGRRKQADARLTGLVMLDFDGVDDPKGTFKGIMAKHPAVTRSVMLAHITPSGHGLRLVCKADAAIGNLADNQAHIAATLGMEIDESCKDASRISFAFPKESLLYIQTEIFTYQNEEYDQKYGESYRQGNSMPRQIRCVMDSGDGGNSNSAHPAANNPIDAENRDGGKRGGNTEPQPDAGDDRNLNLPTTDDGKPAFKGVAYKDIIAEWWRQQGGVPVVGERNQKLHRLASHLRYLCDNSADALAEVMPSLGLDGQEVRQLCESACKLRVYGAMPKAMARVLAALGIGDAASEAAADTRDLEADYRERLAALDLPAPLAAIVNSVPGGIGVGALLASLPMFYTLASRVSFTHFDGSEARLSGMTFIIGPAASGKSFILSLDRIIMEPIREADRAGRKVEQEYRDSKELNKNKQKQMDKPHPVIRITPIQISNTMLALRMRDAVDQQDPSLHLHVYSCEAELATALRAQKGGSWIEKNDIYCKAFHNEYWGMDYANDQAINGEIQVNLNLVISGTEDAFDRLIPPATVLSGLPTRLMYFQMPDSHYTMISKGKRRMGEADEKLIRQTAYALDTMRGHVDASRLADHMYKWCERMAKRAELEEDEELDDLRKRTALIGERAGVAYALIAQQDAVSKGGKVAFGKRELAFAEFVADYCLYSQYKKFAERMKEQKRRLADDAGVKRQPMLLADIYCRLPKLFTIDELAELRPGVGRGVLRSNVFNWKKRGYIKPCDDQKHYEKIIIKV